MPPAPAQHPGAYVDPEGNIRGVPALTNNSYISIGLAILIVMATLWIKQGQTDASEATRKVSDDLIHYKEIQKLTSDLSESNVKLLGQKLDELKSIVQTFRADDWNARDEKMFWKEFHKLNPNVVIPEIKDNVL